MRTRTVFSIALLLLPLTAGAQRFPTPRTGTAPGQPVPIGRQPEPIARAQEFQRLRVSVESYPIVSYLRAPGFPDRSQATSWTTVGAGSRLEYRLTPRAAATFDLTSSVDGSPMRVQTAEIGGRLRGAPSDSRLTPYADVRVAFLLAQTSAVTSGSPGFYPATTPYTGASSYGFGAMAGAGIEYALTNTWAMTTGASLMQSRLGTSAYSSTGGTTNYGMTSARVTLGIKYNPVRSMVMKSER